MAAAAPSEDAFRTPSRGRVYMAIISRFSDALQDFRAEGHVISATRSESSAVYRGGAVLAA